jgi:hypothetical protein
MRSLNFCSGNLKRTFFPPPFLLRLSSSSTSYKAESYKTFSDANDAIDAIDANDAIDGNDAVAQ